jgi:hypothetical protein
MSLRKLYWYKFILSSVFVLAIAEVLAIASTALLRGDPLLVETAVVATAFVTISLIALNMGAGTYFAAFKEKNPIRVASSQGASLTFLASMIYLALVVAILAVPLNTYFEIMIREGRSYATWMVVPLVAIGLVSLVVFSFSTKLGLRSIGRDY